MDLLINVINNRAAAGSRLNTIPRKMREGFLENQQRLSNNFLIGKGSSEHSGWLLLVNLGFFMCHIYRYKFEQTFCFIHCEKCSPISQDYLP